MREGFHLVAECQVLNSSGIRDMDTVFSFLKELPLLINMKPISCPVVVRHLQEPDTDWGITGFVLIAESHISIHTYPEEWCYHVDCFSCKPFDVNVVYNRMSYFFNIKNYQISLIHRSLNHAALGRDFHLGEENPWP